MDRARVVINAGEGIIEVEGPPDFVNDKLEKYKSLIRKALGSSRTVSPISEPVVSGVGRQKRGRPRREEPKPSTCIEALRQSLAEGFFGEPRTMGEVGKHLADTGPSYSVRAVRAGLTRLVNSDSLETSGKGRGLRYQAHS